MTCIPCSQDASLRQKVEDFAETLKTEAHKLAPDGMSEKDFYQSGLFRGAVERVRGQYSAQMGPKREFMQHVLNHLQDRNLISEWTSAGGKNRFDYTVILKSGRTAGIELKGCLDGNNTNIFERPPQADEFVIWSVCTNQGASPKKNAWSGIHTRLGAEIIDKEKQVDGLVIWDMVCGTIGRPCPKLVGQTPRLTAVGPFALPPPCLYLFPRTISSPKNNPSPPVHTLKEVELLDILNAEFGGEAEEIFSVSFETRYAGSELQRRTLVSRNSLLQQESKWASIRR